jgi:di/tricarboxylate transporter
MTFEIIFVSALVLAVFAVFVKEKFAPDMVAMGAMGALVATGILSTDDALSVFSNAAPATIACMFVLSAALERTGCLDVVGRVVFFVAGKSPLRALLAIMIMVLPMSALMNNTPIVVVLTPIVIALARSLDMAPSKFLIPLSFAAIFGGSCTLIGTSTNLLVNGEAIRAGLPSFGIFDITVAGAIMAATGLVYMMTIGRFLLPQRNTISGLMTGADKKAYIAEVLIPADSALVGQTLTETPLVGEDRSVLDVIRRNNSLRGRLDEIKLQAGDRIVLEANTGEVLALHESGQVRFRSPEKYDFEPLHAEATVVMEGIIGPHSRLAGRQVSTLNLRRFYGVYLLGVHRHDQDYMGREFGTLRLGFGDTLLIEGPADGIERLLDSGDMISLSHPQDRPLRRKKAPVAILALVLVLLLAAFNVMPIAGLAIIAAVVVVLAGCIDADDAYKAIDWRILFLIYGMLGLSMAMQDAGIVEIIVKNSMGFAERLGPLAILAIVYFITSALTEVVSNNAVAVVLAPIVIAVADQLGLSPYPFLIAIMFGASASFATPIGYQTNTFVYNAGGYKFTDFIKVGGPLNVIMWIVAVTVIPIFWPFTPTQDAAGTPAITQSAQP